MAKVPVRALYQGLTLMLKNLIFGPQVIRDVKRVLCASPRQLMAVSHALGKLIVHSELPYQPQAARRCHPDFSLLLES